MRTLAILALLAAGCAGSKVNALPDGDRAMWHDCYLHVRGRVCAGQGGSSMNASVLEDVCMRHLADKYAEVSAAARPGFLRQSGCPDALVGR